MPAYVILANILQFHTANILHRWFAKLFSLHFK